MKNLKVSLTVKFVMTLLVVAMLAIGSTGWAAKQLPAFSLAWSEYPSWSVFGVAHAKGLIDGNKGKYGPIEEKWGVDIVLKEAEYDPCIQMYGSGDADAVCITNMDALNPAISRASVAIMPTSTSYGADALLVSPAITDLDKLKGVPVYGLAKSVSEYCFVRNIELQGYNEKDFKFVNMDPGAAALAMQQKQNGYDAIIVWNPFVLETLNNRKDVKVLFDSTKIPNEIIDMVVVGQDSLNKPGGENFAYAVIDTYYAVNKLLADTKTHDDTLVAIGEKFSHLGLQDMGTVVKQTKFYATPQDGIKLYTSQEFQDTMVKVVDFCVSHQITEKKPIVSYGKKTDAKVDLRIDQTYMQAYLQKSQGNSKPAKK